MGKEKHIRQIEALFKNSPVVEFSSISRIINNKKKVRQYGRHLVRALITKGRIKRLSKGYYTTHDDPSLAVFCFRPAYLGLQDALSFHGMWEQETIPIIITAGKARPGMRKISGSNVLIRRIDRRYFFGFDYYGQGASYYPYSDIEKTFIDMLYFKEKLGEETLRNFKSSINKEKLESYLKKYPGRIRDRIQRSL